MFIGRIAVRVSWVYAGKFRQVLTVYCVNKLYVLCTRVARLTARERTRVGVYYV